MMNPEDTAFEHFDRNPSPTNAELVERDPRSLNEAEHFPFDGTDEELIAACRERPWRYAQRVADRLEASLREQSPPPTVGAVPGYTYRGELKVHATATDTQVRVRALEEAAIAVEGVLERQPSIYEYALADAASAIRALAGKEPS